MHVTNELACASLAYLPDNFRVWTQYIENNIYRSYRRNRIQTPTLSLVTFLQVGWIEFYE